MKVNQVVLGLDQGSRSSKAVVLSRDATELLHSSRPVAVCHFGDSVEQDPNEILQSVRDVFEECKNFCLSENLEVIAAGLGCQRSGVCAWDKNSGEVLHPLISWEDTRTQAFLDDLPATARDIATRKTTLRVLGHYAAGKFHLLQKMFPESSARIGTLDSFLVSELVDRSLFITDDSMASRTLLYDVALGGWDAELCKIFLVAKDRLPVIRPSLGNFKSIGGSVPLLSLLGDQQASLLGRISDDVKAVLNLGTISSLSVQVETDSKTVSGFLTNVLYSFDARHLFIEGITNASASVVKFLTEELGVAKTLSEIDRLCYEDKSIEAGAVLPIGGTASPDWLKDLPAFVVNWDKSPASITRAAIEDIGNFISRNIFILKDCGILLDKSLMVSGGLSELTYLVQYISDVTGMTLLRTSSKEATARGAGVSALVSLGEGSFNTFNLVPVERILPKEGDAEKRFRIWEALLLQTISKSVTKTDKIFFRQ